MSSVSLTTPFIPDLVQFNKRGLAYAYLGLLFTFALLTVFFIIELEIHEHVEVQWIYMVTGTLGIVADMALCWWFADSYKLGLRSRKLSYL